MAQATITHEGIITAIHNETIDVTILAQSACSACHSKNMCSLSEMKEKVIHVNKVSGDWAMGENVKVVMTESLGIFATVLAYIIPILIIVGVLSALTLLSVPEYIVGITIIGSLTVYFFGLYFFRKKLGKKFSFKVSKI
jgi:sigma-E factor negative regulatory protein RseC